MHKNGIKALCIAVVLFVTVNGFSFNINFDVGSFDDEHSANGIPNDGTYDDGTYGYGNSFSLTRLLRGYYRAAVFEIFQNQDPSDSIKVIIQKNLDQYAIAAKVAKSQNVDMIVYPEEGLFPFVDGGTPQDVAEYVPDPRLELVNPCDQKDKFQNSTILRNLSCLAKENKFYVVADLIDVKKCLVKRSCNKYNIDYCRTNATECPENGYFFFNTLVVLNRIGFLIERYYKRHLYFEDGITAPRNTENAFFKTEMGKFACNICYDLLFKNFVDGASRPDITQLGYPTWWYDHTPPIYFAPPFQQSWGMTSGVNVLAANVHFPPTGSLGSGIYSAVSGQLVYTYNPDLKSKLLISNVPTSASKIPRGFSADSKFYYIEGGNVTELQGEEPRVFQKDCGFNVLGDPTDYSDYRCNQLEVQQYTFVKLNETKGNINVCSNKFCCSLDYEAQSMNETFYFGVSGNPLNFYDAYSFGTQACFLVRCEPVDGEPCRNFLLKSNTIFKTAKVKGKFDTQYIYPYAINSDLRLTNKAEWNFDGNSTLLYQNKLGAALLFFGMNGRLYDMDKKLAEATY